MGLCKHFGHNALTRVMQRVCTDPYTNGEIHFIINCYPLHLFESMVMGSSHELKHVYKVTGKKTQKQVTNV